MEIALILCNSTTNALSTSQCVSGSEDQARAQVRVPKITERQPGEVPPQLPQRSVAGDLQVGSSLSRNAGI